MIKDIIESVVDKMSQFSFIDINSTHIGIYNVAINKRDIKYWNIGMRAKFKLPTQYYYGKVTGINTVTSVLTVTEENSAYFNDDNVSVFGMDINWKHGHPLDVFNQMSEMANHPDYTARRFPVIALMQDFNEGLKAGIDETPIQVILGVDTKAEFTAKERYVYSYDGLRLTELCNRFITYLELNTDTYFYRKDAEWIDRLYWGKDGALGNTENKADLIDAIELNIELKTLQNC